MDVSATQLAQLFRKHVYRIARNARPVFDSTETIAPPENRQLLRQELAASELLGTTPDGKQILLCTMAQAPCAMREIGRLRELSFRSVGEGTGLPRDIDRFDRDYLQLLLWDPEELEIAGAYRLGDAAALLRSGAGVPCTVIRCSASAPAWSPTCAAGWSWVAVSSSHATRAATAWIICGWE
ncbi:GNAT family N-acetyltransferase [Kineobactrum salinum]|uniref:GNAT family N-acetyltransferase n=1 Tax=Kineobactrum salinum TaxID=2708301 RepID=UPI0038CC032D